MNTEKNNNIVELVNRNILLMNYSLSKTLNENILTLKEQKEFKVPTTYSWAGPSNLATAGSPQFANNAAGFNEIMEEFRNGLYSVPGMTIEFVLTEMGVTAPIVITCWASLLAWDIYRWINGDFDGLNLLFDLLGVVSSGVLAGVLKPMFGELKLLKGKSIQIILEYIQKKMPKFWQTIKPWLLKLSISLVFIKDSLQKASIWMSKNLKSTFLNKLYNKIFSSIDELINKITTWLGANEKTAKSVANLTTKTTKFGLGVLAFDAAAHKAFEMYNQKKSIQEFSNTSIEDIQSYFIHDNPKIYGKPIEITAKRNNGDSIKLMRDINGYFYYDVSGTFVQADNESEIKKIEGEFIRQEIYNDLKFDNFKIIDNNKGIYIINNQKYRGFKNKENKWILQKI